MKPVRSLPQVIEMLHNEQLFSYLTLFLYRFDTD